MAQLQTLDGRPMTWDELRRRLEAWYAEHPPDAEEHRFPLQPRVKRRTPRRDQFVPTRARRAVSR